MPGTPPQSHDRLALLAACASGGGRRTHADAVSAVDSLFTAYTGSAVTNRSSGEPATIAEQIADLLLFRY
jgi:hypothetical protein